MAKLLTQAINIILWAAAATLLFSCHNNTPDILPETVNRTVLVYMVANNNLGQNGFDDMDLAEMQTAINQNAVRNGRLLVYSAGYEEAPVLFEMTKQGNDTLARYSSNEYSVSESRMDKVLRDVKKLSPARSYGIVLWSHGTGWIHDGLEDTSKKKSFGLDNGYKMNTSSLANVLANAPFDLDFIYFDCCYMMSVESLYELRNCAPTIVGSATEIPSPGMPYDKNVPCFFAEPEADLIAAAENTFESYDCLSGQSRTCTMCVVRTSGIERLAQTTKQIYEKSKGGMLAGYEPQRFSAVPIQSCKYFDFKDYVVQLCREGGLDKELNEFEAAFDETVCYKAATPKLWNSVSLSRHNGLSTYILSSESSKNTGNYSSLSWYEDIASRLNFE